MSAPTPRRSAERAPSPVEMTLAEKLACEWEARHDVVARGRVGDAAPLQHYLSHARCEDARRAPTPARSPAARRRDEARLGEISPALRHWLRWGEDAGA
ncbi:hypothetical protein [Blastococcus sp. CCUG 61487]|uniref:hypothetical protein n=1 Tax=Blastococcus sp. CCUG 61487 TaxID=1840703 RepID=UPI0010C0C614|nr:hypothetical protein [Blastococcus sp. CCUG 61487]TKJ31393.1 hypothetical protein A6V29_18355 [Blastococcus sp. CCUG 61487]